MGIFLGSHFFLYLCGMKVRVYPLTQSTPNYYFEYYFEPNYGSDGEVDGYRYETNGWYGSEIFKRDLRDGIVKIITNIKPKQELKKFSLV
jgi:hypothetical protein